MNILDHLDKLAIFQKVGERGSISAAAKELALTQPAITRAIQTLERATGYSLFSRDRSGMHLTPGGRVLFAASQGVLKDITDATIRGASAEEALAGKIQIGTYETLAEYLWPDFLLSVQAKLPHLQISLKTNSQSGHLRELREGTLDLLVDAEPRQQQGLTLWPLYSDHFAFYAREADPLNPETARARALLFVRGAVDSSNITLEQHLAEAGYAFAREYTFDSFTTVKRMAEQGIGVAILPVRLAEKEGRLRLLQASGLKKYFGAHTIYATVAPRRERDARVKALVSMLKKQLA